MNIFDFFKPASPTQHEKEERIQWIRDFIEKHTIVNGDSQMLLINMSEIEGLLPIEKPTETAEVEVIEQPETEATPEVEPTETKPAVQSEIDLSPVLSQLEKITGILEQATRKDDIIRDLHKEMERLNGNFYDDLKRPMIKSIISIHTKLWGRVKNIASQENEIDADKAKLYEELKKNIIFDTTSVSDMLEDEYDLRFYEPAPGDLYNPKEDNALKVLPTDQEGQDNVIERVVNGGFKNTRTDKIFVKANVFVYKYERK